MLVLRCVAGGKANVINIPSASTESRYLKITVPCLLQDFLKEEHVVMADTGDCIFWTQQLKLPYGAG